MEWSGQQDAALKSVNKWIKYPDKQCFRMFGFAGTGKTTLAKHLAENVKGTVLFCAYTGKAAHVLREKGCPDASTIHSLIYLPREKSRLRLKDLELRLSQLDDDDDLEIRLQEAIKAERDNLARPAFSLNTESTVRDAALIVLDECFVGATLVDTPSGPKRIDAIKTGDLILNAYGIDRVTGTKRRRKTQVVKIQCGETTLYCSKSHPFFTDQGIKSAEQLRSGENILQTTKAVRLLRYNIHTKRKLKSLLQSELQSPLGIIYPRAEGQVLQRKTCKKLWNCAKEMVSVWTPKSRSGKGTHKKTVSLSTSGSKNQNQRYSEKDRTQANNTGWKWKTFVRAAETFIRTIGKRLEDRICSRNRTSSSEHTYKLQDRYCKSNKDDCNRSRWRFSLYKKTTGTRSKKRRLSGFSRVDSIEVLEQGHPDLDQYRNADGSLYLYDLAVEGHPSFSVYGNLVHNCSMVDSRIGQDLLCFGTPVLVLGDPAQLPPVRGSGFFTDQKPDVMLTEIHRQARDNPIIRMATMVREGEELKTGDYGEDSRVIRKHELQPYEASAADQILVGKNTTRRACNIRIREMRAHDSQYPCTGDKLVCLRNDHERGLLNGSLWDTIDVGDIGDDRIFLSIRPSGDAGGDILDVEAHAQYFTDGVASLAWWERCEAQEFDYGYALTVHKAQGSQWPHVLLFDESKVFRQNRDRWLYTGLTRASKRITVVK